MSFPLLDGTTGLANAAALAARLTGGDENQGFSHGYLLLIELYPPARDAARAAAHIQRAGAYLASLFGPEADLYALGLGVFALLRPDLSPAEARRLADMLLRRLQREEFVRAHIGLVGFDRRRRLAAEQLLAEAWGALAVARRRGPFGLAVAGGERLFPLFAPAERAKLGRLWHGRERFALLILRQDQVAVSNHFSKRLRTALPADIPAIFLSQREVCLYLEGAGEEEAQQWLAAFRSRMRESNGSTFSAGIALYPCLAYRKSDLPVNCRKALLHAEMVGPEQDVLFSAVTLNISGDAYYNEGDIRRAVAEYRLGLALDPANINLCNSLGVALIQLKQSKPALACFEKALAIEPANFMALVNLGFVYLNRGRDAQALAYFEQALAVNDRSFDLLLQLGRLYWRQGRYQPARQLLTRAVEDPDTEERRGGDLATAHRLLGRVHLALGENRPAMLAVQKALALNPRDAEALSMLGEIYAREQEGDEIALSLCRQAVELDGERADNWRRLGWVQWQQGRLAEAADSLRRGLRLSRRDATVAQWLGRIYEQQGRPGQARRMFEKAARWQA